MASLQTDYLVARAQGWRAADALRRARTVGEWREHEADECAPDLGDVRLTTVADDDWSSALDFDGSEADHKAAADRAERDGVWGLLGQYWDGAAWQTVDSVWGFIGDDWRGSGYDGDIMLETLDARAAFMAERARAFEAERPDLYS